ncbi:hypothetical protein [Infirmifilum uzonense]|uniref:hypothetical protein n=1 Tax=Infirmifilum uzonense TaxID=1550241 RepID=UPI000AFF2AB1|nr:hypothetical protein [Infirmifilum uzonense]
MKALPGGDLEELWRYGWEMMERRVKGVERVVRPWAQSLRFASKAIYNRGAPG